MTGGVNGHARLPQGGAESGAARWVTGAAVRVCWLLIGVVPAVLVSLLILWDQSSARPLLDPAASASTTATVTDARFGRGGLTFVDVTFTTVHGRRVRTGLLYGPDGLRVGQTVQIRYSLTDPTIAQDEPVPQRIAALRRQEVVWAIPWWIWGVGWLAYPSIAQRLHRRWAREDREQDQHLADAPDRDIVSCLCRAKGRLTVVIVDAAGERVVPVHDATFRYDQANPNARIVVNGQESTPGQPPGAWPTVVFRSDAVRRILDRHGNVLLDRTTPS